MACGLAGSAEQDLDMVALTASCFPTTADLDRGSRALLVAGGSKYDRRVSKFTVSRPLKHGEQPREAIAICNKSRKIDSSGRPEN